MLLKSIAELQSTVEEAPDKRWESAKVFHGVRRIKNIKENTFTNVYL